jgi:hypothetical protein
VWFCRGFALFLDRLRYFFFRLCACSRDRHSNNFTMVGGMSFSPLIKLIFTAIIHPARDDGVLPAFRAMLVRSS